MACLLACWRRSEDADGNVRSQSYGTRVCGKLAYSLACDKSGVMARMMQEVNMVAAVDLSS